MKKFSFIILTFLFIIIISFITIELAVTLFFYPAKNHGKHKFYSQNFKPLSDTDLFMQSPYFFFKRQYKPNIKFKFKYGKTSLFSKPKFIDININNIGFRDKNFYIEKNNNVKRIISVGDSMIFGEGIVEQNTLVSQLEKQVNEKFNISVETYNFGLGGLNSYQELCILKYIGMEYNPDFVLLGYFINDSDYYARHYKTVNSEKKIPESEKKIIKEFQNIVNKNVYENTFNILPEDNEQTVFLKKLLDRIRKFPDIIQKFNSIKLIKQILQGQILKKYVIEDSEFKVSDSNPGYILSKKCIIAMRQICIDEGIPFLVIIFPNLQNFSHSAITKYPEIVKNFLDKYNINNINLFNSDDFKKYNISDLVIHPLDHHPNKKATDIFMSKLISYLSKNKNLFFSKKIKRNWININLNVNPIKTITMVNGYNKSVNSIRFDLLLQNNSKFQFSILDKNKNLIKKFNVITKNDVIFPEQVNRFIFNINKEINNAFYIKINLCENTVIQKILLSDYKIKNSDLIVY